MDRYVLVVWKPSPQPILWTGENFLANVLKQESGTWREYQLKTHTNSSSNLEVTKRGKLKTLSGYVCEL